VQLASLASHRQRAVFHDVERSDGHIEYLAALRNNCILYWQSVATAVAVPGQPMIEVIGGFRGLLEGALLPRVAARQFTGDWRNELVFFAKPSDDGGLLEFSLFMPSFASSASMRANSVSMRLSLSVCDSRERSGRLSFGGLPECCGRLKRFATVQSLFTALAQADQLRDSSLISAPL
jgi:hypothetical protein